MSRLIDADAFIAGLNKYIDKPMTAGLCATLIELQPTAYDVEKVVAELEEKRIEYELYSESATDDILKTYRKGIMRGYEYSKDIVRKGGVE